MHNSFEILVICCKRRFYLIQIIKHRIRKWCFEKVEKWSFKRKFLNSKRYETCSRLRRSIKCHKNTIPPNLINLFFVIIFSEIINKNWKTWNIFFQILKKTKLYLIIKKDELLFPRKFIYLTKISNSHKTNNDCSK